MKNLIASLFFNLGILLGCIPIIIASLITRVNLFTELSIRMEEFWKSKKLPF